jgi:hypothetical protein
MNTEWASVLCNGSTNQEVESIIQDLQRLAPHIRWRTSSHDHEYGEYEVIEVPLSKISEAEYIVKKYEEGYDFSQYSYKNRFPNTFVEVSGEKVINPTIVAYYNVAKEFVSAVEDFQEIGLYNFVERMLMILPKLYLAGLNLQSDDYGFDPFQYQVSCKGLDFGSYDIFTDTENVFMNENVDKYSMSEIVESLMADYAERVSEYRDADEEAVAANALNWFVNFSSHGGKDIIRLLKACDQIHRAR